MSRRSKLLVGVLLLVAIALIVLYPRARRTFKYDELVSQPDAAHRLSVVPAQIELPLPGNSVSLTTLWAEFSVPAGLFTSMSAHETWLRIGSESDAVILLTELHYETQFSSDGNFSFYLDAANVSPEPSLEVFGMSDSEFESHLKLIIGKYEEGLRDRGVSTFETDEVKGFILHGGSANPADLLVQLWDKKHPVCQYIFVSSKDFELREQIAKSIAATFKFTVDSVPHRDTLIDFVAKTAEMFRVSSG